jgi:hypothetical protein
MLVVGVKVVSAAEIVPSIGISQPVHQDNPQAQIYGGLAFRGHLLPAVKSEIGVAYRSEERFDGNLDIRQWPITGSLWLVPTPNLYAGGGVGWYHTTFDYDSSLPLSDETHSDFGVHLGAGLGVPLSSAASLDLNGRYVFLEKAETQLPPREFDPDFWTTTVGLAFRF